MSLKLVDVIEALKSRGRHDEAEYYRLVVPFDLYLLHNISERRVMEMTIDEIDELYRLPPKPAKYSGWNNFYWGKAALNG